MTPSSLRRFFCTVLFLGSLHYAAAQEAALAFKYSEGSTLRFKVTSQTTHEGGLFPGGRLETLVHLYYRLAVTAVDKEGTATVAFIQDSVLYWENKEAKPYVVAEPLDGVPVTMWFSNRGILLDAKFPEDLSKETAEYLDGLMKDFRTEPPLPGAVTEVGASWQNILEVYFIYPGTALKTDNPVKTTYARNERFRGTECARIEYSGNLVIDQGKVGFVRGTMHHALREGKKLRNSSETEATLYIQVQGGRSQMRIKNTQTREALN